MCQKLTRETQPELAWEKYRIREVAIYRCGATQRVQDFEGMSFIVVPFGQGCIDMSPPTKEFYKLLMEGKNLHGGNPVMRWMPANVVVDRDLPENINLTKARLMKNLRLLA